MSHPLRPSRDQIKLTRVSNALGPIPQSSSASIPGVRVQGATAPPPLPPRPHASMAPHCGVGYPPIGTYSPYGGYGRYNGGYGGYSGGYSGLGGYRLSSYGYGGGNFNMPYRGVYNGHSLDDMESSRFYQIAEESSRPAFESIESIVRTFSSVTMMLESTFQAMHTSFHAVMGVAENFDRLRKLSVQVAKYVSAFAVLRTIYWFYRRVLYMLGLIKNHPSSEEIWRTAELSVLRPVDSSQPISVIRSSWPVLTFFGFLIGGPYFIYKLISSIKGSDSDEVRWDPRTHENEEVLVMYKFKAANDNELSVESGEIVRIPTAKHIKNNNSGWILAVNVNNRIGLVPVNYLGRLKKKKVPVNIPESVVPPERNNESSDISLVSTSRPNIERIQRGGHTTIDNAEVFPVVLNNTEPSSSTMQNKMTEIKE